MSTDMTDADTIVLRKNNTNMAGGDGDANMAGGDGDGKAIKEDEDLNPEQAPIPGRTSDLLFGVDEYPPLIVTILFAIQQVVTTVDGPLTMSYFITANLCSPDTGVIFAELLATSIFMGGVATLLQVTFGVRLPIIQGSSFSYIPIIVAMQSTSMWQCPELSINGTSPNLTQEEVGLLWKPRLAELSGSLAVASISHMLLGATGFVGFLMNYVGPLTICPAVALVGLSLFPFTTAAAQHHWGVALFAFSVMVICSLLLRKVMLPLPAFSKEKGCHFSKYPVFRIFPHILALVLSWTLCYILTRTGRLPSDPLITGYKARTDAKLYVIEEVGWGFWPYPGRFGMPTFGVGIFAGMISAVVTSVVESVGDYYAAAKICGVPPPPKHAINRGIAVEGLACILSGVVGAGHATTSYSGAIGYIGITGVGSRIVWQLYGFVMIIFGCFGKLPAALSIVPDPVIGGMSIAGLGMVTSIGLANIKYIDVSSSRNLFILGSSFMLGMMIPTWLSENPGIIQTGSTEADQVLTVLLSTAMFVGGFVGFFLDNIVPGTKEERGITAFLQTVTNKDDVVRNEAYDDVMKRTYDIPFVSDAMRRTKCCRNIPIFPSYVERQWKCCGQSGYDISEETPPHQATVKEVHFNNGLDTSTVDVTTF